MLTMTTTDGTEIVLRDGDRLVDEFGATAVQNVGGKFAPVVNFGFGTGVERWFRLDDRFDSAEEASEAANAELDEAQG